MDLSFASSILSFKLSFSNTKFKIIIIVIMMMMMMMIIIIIIIVTPRPGNTGLMSSGG